MIDKNNLDPAYWEKILEDENLSMERGSMGETTHKNAVLEFLETEQSVPPDQIPGGFTTSEDVGQYGKKKDVFEQLRWKFDGADQFVAGGHGVRGVGSTRHAERVAKIPEWANDDSKIRELLLKTFPKLAFDKKQRQQAGTWVLVIYLWFRRGFTDTRISMVTGWKISKVRTTVRNIKRAVLGKQTDNPNITKGIRKKTGRPRKVAA